MKTITTRHGCRPFTTMRCNEAAALTRRARRGSLHRIRPTDEAFKHLPGVLNGS